MDFAFDDRTEELREQLAAFMDEHVRPRWRLDRPPHIGVWVDRKDYGDVASPGDPRDCTANADQPAVEAFAAVTRHQDHLPVFETRRQQRAAPGAHSSGGGLVLSMAADAWG